MDEELLELAEAAAEGEITEKPPLTDDEVLALVKEDFEIAKKSRTDLEGKIRKWKELYEGKPLGNETEGRSKYVSKDAQKAINWWIPNAMKPFMSSNDIADFIPRTYDDVKKAKSQNTPDKSPIIKSALAILSVPRGFLSIKIRVSSLNCSSIPSISSGKLT